MVTRAALVGLIADGIFFSILSWAAVTGSWLLCAFNSTNNLGTDVLGISRRQGDYLLKHLVNHVDVTGGALEGPLKSDHVDRFFVN